MGPPMFIYLPGRKVSVDIARIAYVIHDHLEAGGTSDRVYFEGGGLLHVVAHEDKVLLRRALDGYTIAPQTPPTDYARTEIARALDEARRAVRNAGHLMDDYTGVRPPGADCLRDALAHLIAAVATLAFPEDAEGGAR